MKVLTVMDVNLDVGIDEETLRINNNSLNVSSSDVMSHLRLCHLAP